MAEYKYTKKVMQYFMNPRNAGRIKNADGIGKAGNILCGDVMWIYIKVGKNKKKQDIIKDIKFETLGCAAAIATSSIITELAKGKTLGEAMRIKRENIIKVLGGLPSHKIHCSMLASDALVEAIYDYLTKNRMPVPQELIKRHNLVKKTLKEIMKRA